MVREVITDKEILSQHSERVSKEDITYRKNSDLIVDLKDTLRNSKSGVGISAIQLGVPKRIIVVKVGPRDTDYLTMINPEIDASTKSRYIMSIEGCLSFPGKEFVVIRQEVIDVYFTTPLGKAKALRVSGLLSRVIQHECDHLDGACLDETGLEYTEDIRLLSPEELQKAIADYKKEHPVKQKGKKKNKSESK